MSRDGVDLAAVDLADPRVHAEQDLSALWEYLRAQRPVHWQPPIARRPGFWVLSRHADVVTAYRDRRFSSERGNMLATLLRDGGDPAGGRMMPVTDGRRHARLRQLTIPAFAPRTLGPLAERVRRTSLRLLDEAIEAGESDFVSTVAAVIPLTTICDLLGVPAADRPFMLAQTNAALGSDQPDQRYGKVWAARNEIVLYFTQLADERRQAPGVDAVSHLAASTVDGQPLAAKDVALNCYSLLLGGTETTGLAMAGAVEALATDPGQWQRLRDGQVGLDNAVEELLRWTIPARHAGRTATEDVTVAGVRIRAGDIVTLWHSSANRDAGEFAAPDRFDLGRTPNRHVSFGHGPHFCLGAQLARLEISSLLTGMRERLSTIELTDPPARVYSNFLAGPTHLPVRLTPTLP